MSEREETIASVDDKSREALLSQGWLQEQTLRSSELLIIKGLMEGKQRGVLLASFIIERDFDSKNQKLEEVDRIVRLSNIDVRPHFQGKGLGTAMLLQLEQAARKFGASRIEGILSASDVGEKPWLPDFYRRRNFELKQIGEGYKILKLLTN